MSPLYRRTRASHCRNGHPYTDANTEWITSTRTWDGRTRNCLTCRQQKLDRRYAVPGFHERAAAKTKRWRTQHPDRYRRSYTKQAEKKKHILLNARAGGCIKCGESDPACLDFHHRNGKKDKLGHIGVFRKFGVARLLAEIAKCDVVCANCHRKLHRDERKVSEGE